MNSRTQARCRCPDSLDLSVEPAAIRHLTPEQKDRLTDLLDGYLRQLEQGLPPSREDLLEANPDLAESLRAYFGSLDELHDMAAGFQRPAGDAGRRRSSPDDPAARTNGDWAIFASCGRSAAAAWAWSTRPSRSRLAGGWP